jgi:hypothetical protein
MREARGMPSRHLVDDLRPQRRPRFPHEGLRDTALHAKAHHRSARRAQ